jgi:hypothetical protein
MAKELTLGNDIMSGMSVRVSIKRASAVGGGSCVRGGSCRPGVADSLLLLVEGWTGVILRD